MAVPKRPESLMAYTVLCQLREAPAHPYKLQRLMRDRGKDWILSLKPESLYHTINQLERAGLIDQAETERAGNRPERCVYRITEAGIEEVESRTHELLTSVTNDFPRAIAPLSHLPGLEPAEARHLLSLRATGLAAAVAHAESLLAEFRKTDLPRVYVVEVEYALALRRAELAWVREIVTELADGSLTWHLHPPSQVPEDHPDPSTAPKENPPDEL